MNIYILPQNYTCSKDEFEGSFKFFYAFIMDNIYVLKQHTH